MQSASANSASTCRQAPHGGTLSDGPATTTADEPPVALGERPHDRGALGADGHAEGAVLDVAAGHHVARLGHQGGADRELASTARRNARAPPRRGRAGGVPRRWRGACGECRRPAGYRAGSGSASPPATGTSSAGAAGGRRPRRRHRPQARPGFSAVVGAAHAALLRLRLLRRGRRLRLAHPHDAAAAARRRAATAGTTTRGTAGAAGVAARGGGVAGRAPATAPASPRRRAPRPPAIATGQRAAAGAAAATAVGRAGRGDHGGERRRLVGRVGRPDDRRPHRQHARRTRADRPPASRETAMPQRRERRRRAPPPGPAPHRATAGASGCPATPGHDQHRPLAAPRLAHLGHRPAGLARGDPRRARRRRRRTARTSTHAAVGDPCHQRAGPQQPHVEADLGHPASVARPRVTGPSRTVTEGERLRPDLEDRERDEHAERRRRR